MVETISMPPRLCVVIPVYNEARHLERLLSRLFAQCRNMPGYEMWAVAVEDQSPDRSWEVLKTLARQYPRLRLLQGTKQGLGIAYQRGFEYAIREIRPLLLVQMDADLQHDPATVSALVERWRPGIAAVIGSRFVPGGTTPAFPLHRRAISRVGNWAIYRGARLPYLHDYTSGFRCLDAGLVARCRFSNLAARGYAFQTSLIAQLLLTGAQVVEIPIRFSAREHGESKLRWRDYAEFGLNIARVRHFRNDVIAGRLSAVERASDAEHHLVKTTHAGANQSL